MPKEYAAGYSAYTPIKHEQLRYIVGTLIGLTSGPKFRGHSRAHPEFLYWDLNSGPGIVNGEPGSPFVFLKEATAKGEPFRGWFHELHPLSAATLDSLVDRSMMGRVICVPGDHNITVPHILRTGTRGISRRAYGLAFADPNGRDDLGITALQAIAARFPYVDFLLNLGAMHWKRIRSVGKSGRLLTDDLARIPKTFKLIREPVGQHQWAMVLCTNYKDIPAFRKLRFHDIAGERGQEILYRLNLLPAEQYQAPLFDREPYRRTAATGNISDIRATEPFEQLSSPDVAASASDATRLG